jgi:hypothetical protein
MKIPKQIKVGAMKYDVIQCSEVIVNNEEVAGSVSPSLQQIKVQTGLKKEFTTEVIIHEIVHAIAHHAGRSDLFADESIIECFANGFTQVMLDNKGIFNS